ncbi:TPM domain-containing protein [Craterilacuibacter sp.]|uniref:TPM domain-containing protein n=1 Tax=Craterilacuibacter sp. TaxID=2870909 RepID=UPI003F33D5FF
MLRWKRLFRHLSMTGWQVRRRFSPSALDAIEHAIRDGETLHGGQVCFALEGALSARALLSGELAGARALDVFSRLRVWDTALNNGVLIYLLLADHDVEIVADRGIHARVGAAGWEAVCRQMEAAFRAGQFEQGAVDGIAAVNRLLRQHYPPDGAARHNELPDRPLVL